MEVKACIYTDKGRVRRINQDSAMIKVANTKRHGRISFAAVCDGMGGLAKGEVASCKAIRALENWFCEELPLMQGMELDKLMDTAEVSLRRLIARVSCEIKRYGKHKGISLGTTLAAILQVANRYLIVNVGDSRIYMVDRKQVQALTADQSVVREKVRQGLITEAEAAMDPERNVLLQCVGMTLDIEPQVERG